MKAKIALFILKTVLGQIKSRPALIAKIDALIPGTLDDKAIAALLNQFG